MLNSTIRLSLLATASLGFLACQPALTQSASTNSDAALTGEAADMGREMDDMAATQGSGISAALLKSAADVDSAMFSVDPPHYDSACACFLRTATWSGDGFERVRVDSITYLDAAGAPLHARNFAKLKSIHHIRRVTRTVGAHVFAIRFETTADVSVGTDTTGVWNGTVTGSYDGETLKSGSITGVTRAFHNHHWGFASAGSLDFTRPLFSWDIRFLGEGAAKAVRTNNLTGHVLTISIDRNYKETAQ